MQDPDLTKAQNQAAALNQLINLALESESIPKIYCNGFTNAVGNSDVMLVLQQNGKPAGVVNMSFTIAKTLSQSLKEIIDSIEQKSNQSIMTTYEVEKFLKP
ncbi:hypothetical protein CLV31_11011 [Algoriphagus aquaeductus]|uniref:Uncharacterized protein n=1 Tax=Algoriphagus aquaeductus TaxID=475299 RepID=A0A326RPQ3_9BACT|nr:hypothetical protein [Algoriphagus aquaeductus]PZV81480.1 hypothetical protein CLV31_11011 [Algoriphagus aquaeductus]